MVTQPSKPIFIVGSKSGKYRVLILAEGFTTNSIKKFNDACKTLKDKIPMEGWYTQTPGVKNGVGFWKYCLKSSGSSVKLGFDPTWPTYLEVMKLYRPPVTFKTICGELAKATVKGDSVSATVAKIESASEVYGTPKLFDLVIVLVNHHESAGLYGSGQTAWCTLGTNYFDWIMHEFGHRFRLSEEYEPEPGSPDAPVGHGAMIEGGENVIGHKPLVQKAKVPWESVKSPGAVVPPAVLKGAGSTDVWEVPGGSPEVAAYEGAGNFHCLCFRPGANCRMRDRSAQFCEVCKLVIGCELDGLIADPTKDYWP